MTKQDPGTYISKGDYFVAKEKWDSFWTEENGYIHQEFHRYLGLSGFARMSPISRGQTTNTKLMIRKSAVRKIEMLNSPHHHALLKAYKAKYQISPITHYRKLIKEGKA